MFIRWKRKAHKPKKDYQNGGYITHYLLYAQLLESYREDGKPRQRVIKHLGGFKEHLRELAHIRLYFWQDASKKLDELSLDGLEREKIEQQLALKVPMLTNEEREQVRQMFESYGVQIH